MIFEDHFFPQCKCHGTPDFKDDFFRNLFLVSVLLDCSHDFLAVLWFCLKLMFD